jgi:hypothetical protein
MSWKWLLALIVVLPIAGQALGQSTDEGAAPLGDVAKKNKDLSKGKAKQVITDDDMSARRKNPIPVISIQGADNSQEILDVIHEFKRTHDAAETERVVHEWFDEQSEVLSDAIEANNRIAQHNQIKMEAAQDGNGYGVAYDGDYAKLRQRQLSEMWAQRSDARSNRDNWLVVTRIQQVFVRVRCDAILNRGKMPYDWFRIRNANGVGTY